MRTVARLMNNAGFLESFHDMLRETVTRHKDTVPYATWLSQAVDAEDEVMQDISESSSTAVDSTEPLPASRSRKRKRFSPGVPSRQEKTSQETAPRFREIVLPAFSVLIALVDLSEGSSDHKHLDENYGQEYIRSVLRTEPTTAAEILGYSLSSIRLLILIGNNHWELVESYLPRLKDMMHSATQVWNYRSGLLDDYEAKISHVRIRLTLFALYVLC